MSDFGISAGVAAVSDILSRTLVFVGRSCTAGSLLSAIWFVLSFPPLLELMFALLCIVAALSFFVMTGFVNVMTALGPINQN
jgi:hypothetical protein